MEKEAPDFVNSTCYELVKRYDYGHYLTALLSGDKCPFLIALYAFNAEIAQVPSKIKEPMMGSIRYEWWREAITKLFAGNVLRHEVIQSLAAMLPFNPHWNEADFHAVINAYQDAFEARRAADKSLYKPLLSLASGEVQEEKVLNTLTEWLVRVSEGQIPAGLKELNPRKIKNKTLFLEYWLVRRIINKFTKHGYNQQSPDWLLGFYLWRKNFLF